MASGPLLIIQERAWGYYDSLIFYQSKFSPYFA